MATIIKPPSPLAWDTQKPSVFLAGSIDMGTAEDWQMVMDRLLDDLDCVLLNPRRDAWDAYWEQSIDNPPFREQVEWELEAQEKADIISFYFDPLTKAGITLLELGLAARSGKALVCCPKGYWRKGNVDIVCQRFNIPTANDLPELADLVRQKIRGR